MATTSRPGPGLVDDFTSYWSQLYTLYAEEILWGDKLCDEGYHGYPEPRYGVDEIDTEPDLFGYHEDGDAHHISVESFSGLKENGDYREDRQDAIQSKMASVSGFEDIPSEDVANWLSTTWGVDFEPNHQEAVILVPHKLYELYESVFEDCVHETGTIVWVIEPGQPSTVSKEAGSHSNRRLENAISSSLSLYPNANDLLQFSRKTQPKYLKFAFVRKLVSYCTRETTREFDFEEVDDIMINSQPPILGHLPRTTREDHWQDYLYSMLRRFELLEMADAENRYRWKKKSFLNEPRYQSRILENVRNELGIGERA